MFDSAFPIIATPDLARAPGFYRDLLNGIGVDPLIDPIAAGPQRFSLWVYTTDCDAAVARLRAGGVRIVEEPADQPWGERVARVEDPDGNVVIIGSPPD